MLKSDKKAFNEKSEQILIHSEEGLKRHMIKRETEEVFMATNLK